VRRRLTLITGAEGFVGSWLIPSLRQIKWEIFATRRWDCPDPRPEKQEGIRWTDIDLCDEQAVDRLIEETGPTSIVHLAALAQPREASADPIEAVRVNYGAVDILLRAVGRYAPKARVLIVSTGQAYGPRAPGTPPLSETEPLRPPNAYSATKAAAEARARLAVVQEDLDVVAVRPMTHTGPGRPPSYVESAFARQIVRIERGLQDPRIQVGNLREIRDFSDVRDVVQAYRLLLQRGERGQVYNVCSGRPWRIGDVLRQLLSLSRVTPEIIVNPDLYRAEDPEHCALVGDPTRLEKLGWSRRYRFEETLEDLLEHWRSLI